MTLNKEQVLAMTLAEAEQYLKKFERHYPLDKPLNKLGQEHWEQMDSIANTLLWLEDHIKKLTTSENIKLAIAKA